MTRPTLTSYNFSQYLSNIYKLTILTGKHLVHPNLTFMQFFLLHSKHFDVIVLVLKCFQPSSEASSFQWSVGPMDTSTRKSAPNKLANNITMALSI